MSSPKFPFVKVKIRDLIDDERNIWILLKRSSGAAQRSQFLPRGAIMEFNEEALSHDHSVLVWATCVEWFDCSR